MCDSILYISEERVKQLLRWDLTFSAVEAALESVTKKRVVQNPRTFTRLLDSQNVLLSMPGYLRHDNFGALACKLVTSFPNNMHLKPALPTINGNIFLFDETTGVLKAIVAGTEITTFRTAAASAVATKHLLQKSEKTCRILAILGAGTQGRIHAIAFQHFFNFEAVHIWNRTKERADNLAEELQRTLDKTKVETFSDPKECVSDADVIVTATFATSPILKREWLKQSVLINAVGAGLSHHSELDEAIYKEADVYVDHMDSAKTELAGLEKIGVKFAGEIGEVIAGTLKPVPSKKITVFQSLGIAAEDCAMARMIFDQYNMHLQ